MALSFPGKGLIVPKGVSILQLILSFLYGSWLGFSPDLLSLHIVILLLSLCILRLPLLLLALTAALCWGLGFAGLDIAIDALGLKLLREPALNGLWTHMYNAPVVPWTRFNNTMVLGATVLAFALLPLWVACGVLLREKHA